MATHFTWDPVEDNIIQERDDTGAITAEYATEPYLYGNLISQNRGGVESQYHFDSQGSTIALTDDNQNVTDTYAYTAFGEMTEQTGSTVNPFCYVGRRGYYWNPEALESIARQRRLVPREGRWLSPVITLDNVLGLYIYAFNAPPQNQGATGSLPTSAQADAGRPAINSVTLLEILKHFGRGDVQKGFSHPVVRRVLNGAELSQNVLEAKRTIRCYRRKENLLCGFFVGNTFKCDCDQSLIQIVREKAYSLDINGKEIPGLSGTKGFTEGFAIGGNAKIDLHGWIGVITADHKAKGVHISCVAYSLAVCCGKYAGELVPKDVDDGFKEWHPGDPKMVDCASPFKMYAFGFCFDVNGNAALSTRGLEGGDTNETYKIPQ